MAATIFACCRWNSSGVSAPRARESSEVRVVK